jgi:hypothetical protein
VGAALWDLPACLEGKDPKRGVWVQDLVEELQRRGHREQVARWAVHHAVGAEGWLQLSLVTLNGRKGQQITPTTTLWRDYHERQVEEAIYYRPAKQFLEDKRFSTYRQLRRFLDLHPTIRRMKPSPQRLTIHLGDWLAFFDQVPHQADPLDLPAEVVEDAVERVMRQKAAEHNSKEGNRRAGG